MQNIQEKKFWSVNGFVMVFINLIMIVAGWRLIAAGVRTEAVGTWIAVVLLSLLYFISLQGYFLVHPNEAKVCVFLGKYVGSARTNGFFWTNPFATRKKVSLRIYNLNSETIKVNDARGNPIEIAAVVVWHVMDSAKALFNVEHYENFVAIQSETAIRTLASHYPYDSHDAGQNSLRANPEEISGLLRTQVQERLEVAGVQVAEARLSHLAYAPEIAQAMLRRQQAEAIIAARRQIVDGAVSMAEMALKSLEEQGVIKLDEDKRAAMVNNLLVALVSESEAQPIINTGTLYS
jgi:regulator of protease activity HflC (stomatin/prohibitin superfamily)